MSRQWSIIILAALLSSSICQAFCAPNRPLSPSYKTQLDMAITERALAMEARSKEGSPFIDAELDEAIRSIQNIASDDADIDYDALRKILKQVAHLSHKDWTRTGANAELVGKILMPDGMSKDARYMLERIVKEGNWDAAVAHSSKQPWAVLVTGVNGIRKTTSMYQPWFPELLAEALVAPPGKPDTFDEDSLPCGSNGFFRQLDHMIAILCNEDFAKLYLLTGEEMKNVNGDQPPKEVIQKYSDLKAAIFNRYRTLSELLGVLLLREAQKLDLNCMMETSGRDVAMFTYVDHFFPERYNKLALHFTINDLSQAQSSVDTRMVAEMKTGIDAAKEGDVRKMMYANVGGPYGSEMLPGVQEASDRVWNDVVLKNDGVGEDWYKATIAITAHPTSPWTAQAVRPDGSLGKLYQFELRK